MTDATHAARALQDEWKMINTSTDTQALWEQFRAELDAVFVRRKTVFDAQDQQRTENLQRKEAACAAIEACAQLDGESAGAARGKVATAKSEFQSAGDVPRDTEKKIRARFERAVRDFDKKLADVATQQKRALVQALERKAALCTTLEIELDRAARSQALEPDAMERLVQSVQQTWQVEPALAEPLESKLSARLKAAVDLATRLSGEGDARAELQKKQEQQRRMAEELCLRLEIATGAESPPDQRAARMQYQVQRLAQKLAGGSGDAGQHEADEIRAQWWLVGPLAEGERVRITERWEAAASSHRLAKT